MSANDILDVLNIQRDEAQQPAKKRQKVEQPSLQKGAMARELYNLLGPNTPPVSLNLAGKGGSRKQRVSPWTRMPFVPNKKSGRSATFHHWEKGSKELLEADGNEREYFFDKFLVDIDIPEMVDEPTFDSIMAEIKLQERERDSERTKQKTEKSGSQGKVPEAKVGQSNSSKSEKEVLQAEKNGAAKKIDTEKVVESGEKTDKSAEKETVQSISKDSTTKSGSDSPKKDIAGDAESKDKQDKNADQKSDDADASAKTEDTSESVKSSEPAKAETEKDEDEKSKTDSVAKSSKNITATNPKETETETETEPAQEHAPELSTEPEWTFEETSLLFELCKVFELKWHVINDRFPAHFERSLEDLKEQFYRVSAKILKYKGHGNPSLLESLDAFSKSAEIDRKQYLESLLKRTPAEIAEEESLVIEARRFELAAKKMLMERTNLLTLLDSPQASQSVQQYQSSQGLTNLYNNLMILDKHQKKKMQQKSANAPADPVPPAIPQAASSSHKRDRSFQTHLQQYLAGVLKSQGPQPKGEPNPIQQLLAKRLTTKEEEAYGLMYHANERLTPNVILRSSQKLPGLQQRQSVFKAVNNMLQELEIPTAGGTVWKPNMPTRKTMAKYDEMVKSVVALLEVKKGKDKLEAEIELIKSQRGLQ